MCRFNCPCQLVRSLLSATLLSAVMYHSKSEKSVTYPMTTAFSKFCDILSEAGSLACLHSTNNIAQCASHHAIKCYIQ